MIKNTKNEILEPIQKNESSKNENTRFNWKYNIKKEKGIMNFIWIGFKLIVISSNDGNLFI